MRRERILLLIGIWVAVLPYLGFPSSWKTVLLSLTGLGLVYISYMMYHEARLSSKEDPETFENFSENSDWNESEPKESVTIEITEEKINS